MRKKKYTRLEIEQMLSLFAVDAPFEINDCPEDERAEIFGRWGIWIADTPAQSSAKFIVAVPVIIRQLLNRIDELEEEIKEWIEHDNRTSR